MSGDALGPGPHTRVRRLPTKATYDSAIIFDIIDEARLCHVSAIVAGSAMVIPTLHAREGRTLYLHGSQSNAVMKSVVECGEAWTSCTDSRNGIVVDLGSKEWINKLHRDVNGPRGIFLRALAA